MAERRESLSESAIRSELLECLWDSGKSKDVLLLEEVGLLQGAYRADVVAVGATISAYEIKSQADTLTRLPHQVRAYNAVFDHVSVVVTACHLAGALEIVPEWWGVLLASDRGGGTALLELRAPDDNPSPDSKALARLLWRKEADQILVATGRNLAGPAGTRRTVCEALANTLSWAELRGHVTEALRLREDWLPAYTPMSCGD